MHRSVKVSQAAAVLTAVTALQALQACLSADGGLWGALSPSDNLADATPIRDATVKDTAAPVQPIQDAAGPPRDAAAKDAAAPAQPPPGGFDTDADGGRVTCGLTSFTNDPSGICSRTFRCIRTINDPMFDVERKISCVKDVMCKCTTEDGTETMFSESGYCAATGEAGAYAAALSKCMWP
jgi:hypothetical protein